MEKKYFNDYDAYEDGKSAETLIQDILEDPEFPEIDSLIIGDWGGAYEDGCQAVIDGIVENADKFAHIKKLFIGDMDYEECEISWIIQGDYSKLWEALPGLESLTIKGSTDLTLGKIKHANLKYLEIMCGGLGADVIKEIEEAELPALKELLLYIGVENYGFDGDADTVRSLLENSDFPALEALGIVDSEIEDDLAAVVFESKYMKQITKLDLGCGSFSDKGGEMLLKTLPEYPNIKEFNAEYNYLSDEMKEKIEKAFPDVKLNLDDSQVPEEWNGEIWYNAMVTE